MLIKWTVIWRMEYSMGRSRDVCLRRSSENHVGVEEQERGGGLSVSILKKMSHFTLSKRKTRRKKIGIARDKA